jgi:hypothetical protein
LKNLLNYALTVGGIAAATLIPAYIALYLFVNLKRAPTKYLAALGLGLVFWFWTDTIGDATYLDVNAAVYPFSLFGGLYHLLVIIAFLLGITALAIFDYLAVRSPGLHEERRRGIGNGAADPVVTTNSGATRYGTKALIFVPVAVAAVIGIHGLGEGWDFGGTAAGVSGTTDIVSAFGGFNAVSSYPIHKFLEASIVAIVYTLYVERSRIARKAKWHIPVLGLLFGLTSVIGASIGYFVSFDTTFFYAFGVTSAIYAAIRVGAPLTFGTKSEEGILPSYFGAKTFLFIGIGFFLLYGAALLH